MVKTFQPAWSQSTVRARHTRMKLTHLRNSNPCEAIPQDMARFNMLDLHETLHTLSQRHQFSHNNCTGQTQNHNKHTTNMVSLQWARFQPIIAHTASMLSSCAQKKVRKMQYTISTPRNTMSLQAAAQDCWQWPHIAMREPRATLRVHRVPSCNPPPPPPPNSRSSSHIIHRWAGNALMMPLGKAC